MTMTFRNSKITYYGPFVCERCQTMICKMGEEFGGNAFNYPEGPIYPNTEWHVHVCNRTQLEKPYPSPPSDACCNTPAHGVNLAGGGTHRRCKKHRAGDGVEFRDLQVGDVVETRGKEVVVQKACDAIGNMATVAEVSTGITEGFGPGVGATFLYSADSE